MTNPIIQINHLFFKYPGDGNQDIDVLKGISLEINRGEFVAVIGANGSGKTTLARHLNGMLVPSEGKVLISGLETGNKKNLHPIRKEMGMVFQNPEDQIIASTLEDDVAFGLENFGYPPLEIQKRVEAALQTMGLWEQRSRPPHLLSAGQMQRLALAGVLALMPECIVFDEVTTMLDPAGRKMVLKMMQDLHRQGTTIIFITHAMEEAALAERILILNQGQLVADGSPKEIFLGDQHLHNYQLGLPPASSLAAQLRLYLPGLANEIITSDDLLESLSTVELPTILNRSPVAFQATLADHEEAMIEIEGLSHVYMQGTPFAHSALEEVCLQVKDKRVHGLLGMTGSGKSTLLQHINGILRPQTGTVRVGNYHLEDPKLATKTVVQMVGLVFQNPEMQFFEQYVGDEIAFGPRQYPLSTSIAERVRLGMEQAGLKFERFKDRLTYTLSGGEKRKVALAAVLAIDPSTLLLDEPTAGLDPESHGEVLNNLKALAANGKNMVISSHQMEDLSFLAQDATLFKNGKVLLSGEIAELFNQKEILHEAGMDQPIAMKAAGILRERGLPIPANVLTVEDLMTSLTHYMGVVTDGAV
jgi:energy-coupling factor transport system ATP-binding protein